MGANLIFKGVFFKPTVFENAVLSNFETLFAVFEITVFEITIFEKAGVAILCIATEASGASLRDAPSASLKSVYFKSKVLDITGFEITVFETIVSGVVRRGRRLKPGRPSDHKKLFLWSLVRAGPVSLTVFKTTVSFK